MRPKWVDSNSPLLKGPWSPKDDSAPKYTPNSKRTGLIARKIGMVPQWLNSGTRVLCTILEFPDNHVVSAVDPETWFRLITGSLFQFF